MTPLPIDPARTEKLVHDFETLMALSGCTTAEGVAAALAIAFDHGQHLTVGQRAFLLDAVSTALTLAAKPRLDA